MKFHRAHNHLAGRPHIPLVLWSALAFWIGAYAGYELTVFQPKSILVGILLASGMTSAAQIVYWKHTRKICNASILILFVILGVLLSICSTFVLEHQRALLHGVPQDTYRIRIEEDLIQGEFGYQAVARIYPEGANTSFLVELYSSQKLPYGSEGWATLSFSQPSESAEIYYNRNGLIASASLYSFDTAETSSLGLIAAYRAEFTEQINTLQKNSIISEQVSALMKALIVGDRTTLFSLPVYQEVKILGLAHLVAVSGSHLVIVMGFLNLIMRVIPLSRKVKIGVQLIILLAYLVMVGFPISCVRAAVMTAVSIISLATARRSHALSGLSVVIIGLLCVIPSSASSLSFALSALATLGIIVFMPLFSSWLERLPSWFIKAIGDPFAMTIAATFLTLPLSLSVFSQFSLIAPVANVLSVPFITLICCLGLIGCICMPVGFLSNALLCAVGVITSWFCSVISFLASIPGVAIPVQGSFVALTVMVVILVVALWIFWPSRPALYQIAAMFLICFVLAGISGVPSKDTEIIMLDVGQGDAFLIRSEGKTMLVDTGNSPQKLYAALARHCCYALDALLVTHADDDHCGCVSDLKGVISCKSVFLAKGIDELHTDKTDQLLSDAQYLAGSERVVSLTKGDQITFGSISLRIVSPQELVDNGENQDSICFVLQVDIAAHEGYEWSAFFCGDAESETAESIVNNIEIGDIDILKVAHHGAESALSSEMLQTLKPEVSLISVGERNRYGHPHPTTLSLLEECNSQVYRSDVHGDVVCKFEPEKIVISTMG